MAATTHFKSSRFFVSPCTSIHDFTSPALQTALVIKAHKIYKQVLVEDINF